MVYSGNRPGPWWSIVAFMAIQSTVAGGDNDALDIIPEDPAASIRARVTRRETTETPISPILCSNFIEVGFGYQVEGMWSEMLYNRSFEKWVPLRPNSANWYDLKDVAHGDWTSAPWYHTAYEHNRWYAWPGSDAPFHIGPDSTMIIDRSAEWRVRIIQAPGGDHGSHCLHVVNFKDDRWVGVAQDGKFFHPGQTYRFRGQLRRLSDQPLEAELRFYATSAAAAPGSPLGVVPLGEIGPDKRLYEASFSNDKHEGWTTLALAISPGSVEIDAFSLMPASSVHGWRPEIFEALKRLNPGVIRFPGGCFASFHNWQDAIGPRDRRKPEPSYFWGDTNMNDVGTLEFLQLCEQVDAEPMLVVNFFHPMKRFFIGDGRTHGYDLPGITDPEAGIRGAAACPPLEAHHVSNDFRQVRQRRVHHFLGDRSNGVGLAGFRVSPAESWYGLQSLIDLGGNEFIRHTPLEDPLDPVGRRVDVGAAQPTPDHFLLKSGQLSGTKLPHGQFAVGGPDEANSGLNGVDFAGAPARLLVVAFCVTPVGEAQFGHGRAPICGRQAPATSKPLLDEAVVILPTGFRVPSPQVDVAAIERDHGLARWPVTAVGGEPGRFRSIGHYGLLLPRTR